MPPATPSPAASETSEPAQPNAAEPQAANDPKAADKPQAADKSKPAAKAAKPKASAKSAPKPDAGKSEPPSDCGEVLVVTARRPRRRAGRAFGKEPTEIPLADLSDPDRVAIEGDPALTVKIQPAD
ncbi:hypothetical protein [Stappia stellulata]|uniref:hypothetical protein n=1 Tax=Stappia stellulata TaxID=71235 RepID=UPI0004280EA5|nr:hypothetical protein [Stappia stellulata]